MESAEAGRREEGTGEKCVYVEPEWRRVGSIEGGTKSVVVDVSSGMSSSICESAISSEMPIVAESWEDGPVYLSRTRSTR